MNGWLTRVLIILAAGALLLRLWQLDRRPLHNDEAVNATKLQELAVNGVYKYNPHEFHGPALHYFSLPFIWLNKGDSQFSDANLRLATVFFGAGLVLLLWLTAPGLGRVATLAAGGLLAISPAMVFYSRYFIHEMLLVFFGGLAMGAGWRYATTGKAGWAITCGIGIGLMYATKETFVFQVGAMAAAALALGLWHAKSQAAQPAPRPWLNWTHWLFAAVAGLVVGVVLFSSFFTNAQGPLDSIRTYEPWLKRAGGASPHNQPWYYYFQHLFWFHPAKSPVWTEGLVLVLAVIGGGTAVARKNIQGVNPGLARFLVIYTVLLTLIYSGISYKTPWCLLGFYHGMILLAGMGVAFLVEICRSRWAKALLGVALAVASTHLGYQAWRACHPVTMRDQKGRAIAVDFSADPRNPYVHSQSRANLLELVRKVEAISRLHPDGRKMLIKVFTGESPWPLPWYLREFTQVGWWEEMIPNPYAPVIIVNSQFNALLDEKSDKKYLMVGLFELRPSRTTTAPKTFLELYVEVGLWTRYVESLPKTRDE